MNPDDRLTMLMDGWQEAQARGEAVTPENLCRDWPELLPELARQVTVLRRFDELRTDREAVTEERRPARADTVTGCPAATGSAPPAAQPSALPIVGQEFGGYRIAALLGEGGMGCVYRVADPVLRREVALKVMRPEVAARPQARARFLREARALAALQHDHVALIFQVGEADGVPFLTMPLLRGESLAALMKRETVLTAAEVLRIGREAAEGLAAVHAACLVHRDFKPSNLWLEADTGRVKLLDFGLAREQQGAEALTQEGTVVGTREYMSPEQIDGQPLDARADLFSLGAVLYECATGRRAFAGKTHWAVLVAVARHELPAAAEVNPSMPSEVSTLIGRLMAKAPADRPESARDVVEAIRAIETRQQTVAYSGRPDVKVTLPAQPQRPDRWTVGCSVQVTIGVLLLLWISISLVSEIRRQPESWYRDTRVPPNPPVKGGGADGAPTGGVTPESPVEHPAVAVLTAKLDVRVWKKRDTSRGLALDEPGALPLQAGDRMRFEVRLNRPGYVYLIYIDARGEASPLYPWRNYKWDDSAPEAARDLLNLPENPTKDARLLEAGPAGIDAVLLLVRDKPLTETERRQLAGDLAGRLVRPPAKPDLLRGAVWLGDHEGPRFSDPRDRGRPGFGSDQAVQVEDPVEQVRLLLRTHLQSRGEARAVCFSFAGQP